MIEADAVLFDYPVDVDPCILGSVYSWRARLRAASGKMALALEDVDRAIELEPDNGDLKELRQDILEEMKTAPDPEPVSELDRIGFEGALHLQYGRLDEALATFNRLLQLDPQNAKAYQMRGAVFHEMMRFEEELADLNRSYEIDRNEVALFNRSNCLVKLGRVREGLADLREFGRVGQDPSALQTARRLLAMLEGA